MASKSIVVRLCPSINGILLNFELCWIMLNSKDDNDAPGCTRNELRPKLLGSRALMYVMARMPIVAACTGSHLQTYGTNP